MSRIDEIKKRRTFAIISHPDAGKTTLTEKFLLYGGAINQAGSVKGKATAKHAVSDWMDIEKERGISVTSSVLQFEYGGCCINILDTPGHQDFSEGTYRTLMAADSAVMVIDASKGVEAQTRKLFKVCAMRHIPVFTFINKMDREARDIFDLLDEIEKELHPTLVEFIVAKFQSKKTNPNEAQIVFTTHNTDLLSMELLRKDQLYFVDKDKEDGASELYSISDFSTRTTENVRKGYLLGKYGATPNVEIEEVE